MSALSRLLDLARSALDSHGGVPSTPVPPVGRGGGRASVHPAASSPGRTGEPDARDRAAIARYDYLVQTADPHVIEQVHREAFAALTPEQRARVEGRMHAELPEHERPRSSSFEHLARAAARTEAARPGSLRGLLARAGAGRGRGPSATPAMVGGAGLAAGGVLAAVAGGAVVSSLAGPLLEQAASLGVDFDALAGAVDLEALSGGLDGLAAGVGGLPVVDDFAAGVPGVDELSAGAGDAVSNVGNQLGGLGDQVRSLGSSIGLPNLDDLFGR